MTLKTKSMAASGLMTLGLAPYFLVLSYIAWTRDYRGDAGMAAIFMAILGLGIAYLSALTIALPASLWSSSLAKSSGRDSRISAILRGAVLLGVFPLFVVFPVVAMSIFR